MRTVTLGREYDDALKKALADLLQRMGAVEIRHERGHAGSQDVEVLEVAIGEARVVIEAETYMGLSVTGPEEIVAEIDRRLRCV